MTSRPYRLVLVSWITLLVILFGSLAPSISHALNAKGKQATSWAEICSADGMRFIQTDNQPSDSSAPGEHGLHMEDCPYCLNHAGALGLPPSSEYVIPRAVSEFMLPSLFYQSPQPLFIWTTAQSRAPPFLS
ncbi:DUF2946 domain-containing protein [Herminiimonas arsenitoxidans]|uniref:DUF2946 domain-containing protein n=1 Tax=Herminiimonas arsenitoxidans TaxID=1809410 RepID=UPI00097138FF|nr:DUF2946 domain-containing protein [Herminiimonas arsenitoxidans]